VSLANFAFIDGQYLLIFDFDLFFPCVLGESLRFNAFVFLEFPNQENKSTDIDVET